MSIFTEQNSKGNLCLLAAQRQLYSEAKSLDYVRIAGAVLLAVIGPVVLLIWPAFRWIPALVSVGWVPVSQWVIASLVNRKTREAATIQEQFDVALFGLPWRDLLVGNRVSPELIHSADQRFKGDRDKLRNWYDDTGNVPYPMNVILCQRENLVWDWRLRRSFGWLVGLCTAVWFGLGVMIAILTHKTVLDYVVSILVPSMSVLLLGVEMARQNFEIAEEKEKLEKKITSLWQAGLVDPKSITLEHCREIQDRIFSLRSKVALVPDWLYWRLRGSYGSDSELTNQEMKTQAENSLRCREL